MKEVIKAIEAYEKRAKQLAHMLVLERLDISKALRESRLKKRLSLRAMAKILGISAAFLSDVELGHRAISSNLLKKLRKL